MDAGLQRGVKSSICAVSGRQTVAQKDSILTLYQHRHPLIQEAGLSSLDELIVIIRPRSSGRTRADALKTPKVIIMYVGLGNFGENQHIDKQW